MANSADHKLSAADEDHREIERISLLQRAQWVRAAILGANDGLLSTTSLMLGVGAAKEDLSSMVLSGLAGAIAGACSMAVGEFVSVSTQRDIEKRTHENQSWKQNAELSRQIDEENKFQLPDGDAVNLSPATSSSVKATAPGRNVQTIVLSPVMRVVIAEDVNAEPVEAEELSLPNPFKAAIASALSFLCGSIVPLLSALTVADNTVRIVVIVAAASIALFLFGGIGARLGGSPIRTSAIRVLIGGWIAMGITYGVLAPFDVDHKNANAPSPEA